MENKEQMDLDFNLFKTFLDHEHRITKLEELVKQLNTKNTFH